MCGVCSSGINTCHNVGAGHYTLCDRHSVHMKHGLDYEDLVSTSNVLLFGINIKCIQKVEFEFI